MTQALERDPLPGDLFLFVSKNRKRARLLMWDGTGLCVYVKRLEQGCFACLWEKPAQRELRLTVGELQLFFEGSELAGRVPLSPAPFLFETPRKTLDPEIRK